MLEWPISGPLLSSSDRRNDYCSTWEKAFFTHPVLTSETCFTFILSTFQTGLNSGDLS